MCKWTKATMPNHLVFLFGLTGFISFPRLAGGINHLADS